jgi:hypothetical protein
MAFILDVNSMDCKDIFTENSNRKFTVQITPPISVRGYEVSICSMLLPLSFGNLIKIPSCSISIVKDGYPSGNTIHFKRHRFYPSSDSLIKELNGLLHAYDVTISKSNSTQLLRIKVGEGLTLTFHRELSKVLGFHANVFNMSNSYYTANTSCDPLKGFRVMRVHSSIIKNDYTLNNHCIDVLKTFSINDDPLNDYQSMDFASREYRKVSSDVISLITFQFKNLHVKKSFWECSGNTLCIHIL